jgi:hypothetical protein
MEKHAETLALGKIKYMLFEQKRHEVVILLVQLMSVWSEVKELKVFILQNTKGVAPISNHNVLRKLTSEIFADDFKDVLDVLSSLFLGPPVIETCDQWYDEQYMFMIDMMHLFDESFARHEEYIPRVHTEIAKGCIEVDYLNCLIREYQANQAK